ncbi:hypothetical protein P7H50_07225 [Enterococcus durans]|uniref:hypothetical protein n=1 Tax=Enterococcus TaxID=1350 RepID=UPI0028922026|nr:hypothetical protein [Enterococcus durans]MDT2836680.1 hypothetical protein [Enterococcus durans]
MFEILKIFFVYIVSLNLSAFLGVGLLALFFQFKKRSLRNAQAKWSSYLQRIGPKGMVWRLYLSYMISLSALAILNYTFAFNQSIAYTITLLIAGIFHLSYKYQLNKSNLTNRFK